MHDLRADSCPRRAKIEPKGIRPEPVVDRFLQAISLLRRSGFQKRPRGKLSAPLGHFSQQVGISFDQRLSEITIVLIRRV